MLNDNICNMHIGNGKIKIGSNILSCKRSIEREIKNFAKWQIQKKKIKIFLRVLHEQISFPYLPKKTYHVPSLFSI